MGNASTDELILYINANKARFWEKLQEPCSQISDSSKPPFCATSENRYTGLSYLSSVGMKEVLVKILTNEVALLKAAESAKLMVASGVSENRHDASSASLIQDLQTQARADAARIQTLEAQVRELMEASHQVQRE